MSDDKYEIEVKLSKYDLEKIFKEYGTGKYHLIEDTPTFKLLMDRVVKKMKEAADERHS